MTTPDVPAERERDELRPCPFCGEAPYLHEPDFKGDDWQVGCRCEGGGYDEDEHGAIWRNGKTFEEVAARWNRRAAPQEAREPEPTMRRVRAPKRRTCRDCGDTINAGESALRVGDGEVFHVGYQCGCAEKREAARPAPETEREPELLGYVVERQRTPGEWVRVWRGSTLWFDHDEAVLERDAYALDGIPARIRGVYLGAPAPAEATERSES